ncbi:MAG: porphobilinogen synthase [Candidatus Omnitrophica bacterium]|nr:porphobilinogen synthase [Candidatus Omnitrophota bacterium]
MRPPSFPSYRARRLRNPLLRDLIAETSLEPGKLIAPLFVTLGGRKKLEVPSMPGVFRLSVEEAAAEAKLLAKLGVGGVLLFGIPPRKDLTGSGAFAGNGVVQQALKAVKRSVKDLLVMTDVCLCEYTAHGHCGIVTNGDVDNDATLEVLARTALSHARAGADFVAPSAMMDGQVGLIRAALDREGFSSVGIMGYSAKYASALYGPFREAVESAPKFGDRRGYQMDPRNAEEALREVALDIQEGADIVMVKPAISSLDLIRAVKRRFHWPTAAFSVSGEYALIKAAAARGWVEEKRLVLELLTSIRRAGADLIITYYAKQLAQWLRKRGGS